MSNVENKVGKVCCNCKKFKEYSLFYKASKRADGHQTQCKACDKVISQERHLLNRDKRLARSKEYAARPENKIKAKEYHARNWQNNKEKMYARSRKWAANNMATLRKLNAKRRCAKKQATPKWADSEFEQFFIEEIYKLAVLREKYTSKKWHVDHKVPLQSDKVCGLHCAANLQIMEASENMSKCNVWWEDMP